MGKQVSIEELLKSGSKQWNQLRKDNKVPLDHTGATFPQLFSANADLSGLTLIGTEWEKCDLSKVSFKEADLIERLLPRGPPAGLRLPRGEPRGRDLREAQAAAL